MTKMTQAERITALETQVASLNKNLESVEQKLDELLALKNRGVGAFWLMSILVGTGLFGVVTQVMSWVRG